jgi:hypothetical protein
MAKKIESDRERGLKVLARVNKANTAWIGSKPDHSKPRTIADIRRDLWLEAKYVRLSHLPHAKVKRAHVDVPQLSLFDSK